LLRGAAVVRAARRVAAGVARRGRHGRGAGFAGAGVDHPTERALQRGSDCSVRGPGEASPDSPG